MKRNAALSLIFLTTALQGCGQTGPLYLPDAPPPIHTERQKSPETKTVEPAQETAKPVSAQ